MSRRVRRVRPLWFALGGCALAACARPDATPGPRRVASGITPAPSAQASTALPPMPAIGAREPYRPLVAQRLALPNGLEICLVERHEVPLVVATFSATTPHTASLALATSWAAAIGERGLDSPSQRAISLAASANDVSLQSWSSIDWVFQAASAPGTRIPEALGAALGALRDPDVPASTLSATRTRILGGVEHARATSASEFRRSAEQLRLEPGRWHHAWTTQDSQTLNGITRADLERLHRATVLPSRLHLVVVGDVGMSALEHAARALDFGDAGSAASAPPLPVSPVFLRASTVDPAAPAASPTAPTAPPATDVDLRIADYGPTPLTTVGILSRALDRHPDEADLVLRQWLDKQMYERLREDGSLTYSVSTNLVTVDSLDPRTWLSSQADVTPDGLERAVRMWVDTVRSLVADGLSQAELDAAASALLGQRAYRSMTHSGAGGVVFDRIERGLPCDARDDFAERLAALRPNDVRDAARRYFGKAGLTVLIVGDKKKLQARIRALDPILDGRAPI